MIISVGDGPEDDARCRKQHRRVKGGSGQELRPPKEVSAGKTTIQARISMKG